MNRNSLVKFDQVSFGYPAASLPVMKEFDLEIGSGTITAILGPNGAGKTTFLHLALGWLKPQSGKILIDRRPLGDYSRRALGQCIGLVPQSEHTPFAYSLLEFVLLGRAPHLPTLAMPDIEDFKIAVDSLEQVGLSDMKDRSILNLSGGERQLVLIARAMTQQPRLLLLDEPTSHLDLSNKGRVIHILRELSEKGVTIVYTTHEPEVVSALATHLVLMQKGQVQKSGTLDEVFNSQDLSLLYQMPVSVVNISGKRVALWT